MGPAMSMSSKDDGAQLAELGATACDKSAYPTDSHLEIGLCIGRRRKLQKEADGLPELKAGGRVAAILRRMLVRGEIVEGTILPPESELMAHFSVSRQTLREAFRVLESESLIKTARGVRGARVHRPCLQTLARYAGQQLEYEAVTLRDVYNARAIIEAPMIVQLTKNGDPAFIARLEEIVEREVKQQPGTDAVDQLTDFHVAISQLSENKTLRMVDGMLHQIIAKGNCSLRPATTASAAWAVRRSARTHRKIVDLINEGEADRAGELWSAHLRSAEEVLYARAGLSAVIDLLE
jgi:GntR family transcriptional repressor for pyruvate dehydrogenase complex